MRSRTAALSAVAALVTGCWLTALAPASAEPTTEPSAEPTTQPSAKPSAKPTTEPSAKPTTEPSAKPTTEPSAEPDAEPAQPRTSIEEDGTYTVGPDIVAGTYSTAGPVEGEVCYWKRMSRGDGTEEGSEVLENAMTKKPQVVKIDPSDGAFVTSGCQPWQQTAATDGGGLPPELDGLLGKAKLRHYIDTLNRNAAQFGQVPLP